ncbi:MAG: HD domain-containing protein [Bacteroidales bacterium]|nr:HD domain-containing protein [Bacteroidales bacterium]
MIAEVIDSMINYFESDIKRINHALKVYGFANCIVRKEKLSEKEILTVEIAAVLHDIGIKEAEIKYHSSIGKYQEIEGPIIAKKILTDLNFEADIIDRVCFIIGNHHTYQNIDGLDFQIIVESDFLVNIFEDEIETSSLESIKTKYFKTSTGRSIIQSMYLKQ